MPDLSPLRPIGLGLAVLAAAAAPAQSPHWAYRPLADATATVDIDAAVAARLADAGLARATPADRATLIRRLHLVLHGMPPTPAAVAAARDDRREDWFERRIDALLASPRRAERLAQAWLDVARYADTHGFETNTPRPNAWRYRDWVIDAFRRDLPFDRFVIAQLAGDAIGEAAATGFLVAGPWDEVKSPDPRLTAEQRSNELADMVGTTGMAFLGTTVGCARCHDHKFDPVRQTDFHAIEAVFAGVRHGDRELPPPDDEARRARLAAIDDRLAAIDDALALHEPHAGAHAVTVIDDEDPERVELLASKAGHGEHPAGDGRGLRDDHGDRSRAPNLGRGRYTWWRHAPGQDLIAYRPALDGEYRLWVSWGAGFDTHCRDAAWLLDADGDPATRHDQQLLAVTDQQRFAPRAGEPSRPEPLPASPRFSGLQDLGIVELTPTSQILLRGGPTGTAATADVIVLQPVAAGDAPAWRVPVDALGNVDRFAPVRATAVRLVVEATLGGIEPCIDELVVEGPGTGNVALAARGAVATASSEYPGNPRHKIPHANDGRTGNDHSWIPRETAAAWLQLDLAEPAVIDRVRWARDADGVFADRLATAYRIEVRDATGSWQTVASSNDRLPHGSVPGSRLVFLRHRLPTDADVTALLAERSGLVAERRDLATLPRGYVGRFEPPPPTHRLHRGDPMAPREVILPGGIRALGAFELAADTPESERRLAFARWLTSGRRADLVARVVVNRIWQQLFGTGFVTTPNDFGHNGAAPSHPELLDALAAELIADGWSLRRLTRRILLTETWRQAWRDDPAAAAVDGANRLLWRHPLRRLDAEPIRDALLAVSGELDLTTGGPGFDVFEPNSNYVRVYEPKTAFGPDTLRRAIYAERVRMERDPTFGAFDCPDAARSTPRRTRSTTPQQALSLLNSPFVVGRAEAFAARVAREAGDVTGDRVERAFQLALQRAPAADERREAIALVDAHGLPALCRALFQTNEFVFVP